MSRLIIAAVSGGLFGAGLHLSGMTDTARVRGFLDLFGAWDPTLAFVMGGALLPMALAWRWAQPGAVSWSGAAYPARPDPQITARLAVGSVLFGIGWGLVGLCPGPAIAALSYGGTSGALFVLAMLAGMAVAPAAGGLLDRRAAAA
ncbi:MAG: DUF6691 family protein [Pseudomonadota bacterium]